jgi:hypothetical protein
VIPKRNWEKEHAEYFDPYSVAQREKWARDAVDLHIQEGFRIVCDGIVDGQECLNVIGYADSFPFDTHDGLCTRCRKERRPFPPRTNLDPNRVVYDHHDLTRWRLRSQAPQIQYGDAYEPDDGLISDRDSIVRRLGLAQVRPHGLIFRLGRGFGRDRLRSFVLGALRRFGESSLEVSDPAPEGGDHGEHGADDGFVPAFDRADPELDLLRVMHRRHEPPRKENLRARIPLEIQEPLRRLVEVPVRQLDRSLLVRSHQNLQSTSG